MKVLALSKKHRSYIPKDFREEENPPRFTLRSMTRLEFYEFQNANKDPNMTKNVTRARELTTRLQERMKTLKTTTDNSQEISQDAVEIGYDVIETAALTGEIRASNLKRNVKLLRDKDYLTGWENVPVDVDGEFLEFSKENIECLDEDLIEELAMEISGAIGEPNSKNSMTPLSVESGTENNRAVEKDGIALSVETKDLNQSETAKE